MRTRVSLLGHDDFVIKVPNAAGHVHLKPGETVRVGWQIEDCRALDAV
jgi:putative spermidine/putrescine transport system ATP-binding protein